MIQDVLKMDFPIKKHVSLDTTVPLFISGESASDDIHWFGRILEAGQFEFENYHRYRFIEYVGDYLVERTILTEEEIDINSDWSKSEISVWPIYAKCYPLNERCSTLYERYAEGLTDVLQCMCVEDHCTTIHGHIDRELRRWKSLPNLKNNEVYDQIITGKFLDNIGSYKTCIEAVADRIILDYEAQYEAESNPNALVHSKDINGVTSTIYGNIGLKLKDLQPLKANCCGLWNIGVLNGTPNRLFDPNGKEVIYGFTKDETKWIQFGLFDVLLWSDMTDIYFDAEITQNIGRADMTYNDFSVLNRYRGTHADPRSCAMGQVTSTEFLNEIVVILCKLALHEWNFRVTKIKFLMNWWSEIYIELTDVDNNVRRIWYDSTLITLADPSLLPMPVFSTAL